MIRYKVNKQKSTGFPHTSNEQVETKIRKTIPFITAPRKYSAINLTILTQNLDAETTKC